MMDEPILPIAAAADVAQLYDLDEVIVIARTYDDNLVHVVTYGKTREACGFAAMAGRQLHEVIKRQSRSLEDALAVAAKIRPEDVG